MEAPTTTVMGAPPPIDTGRRRACDTAREGLVTGTPSKSTVRTAPVAKGHGAGTSHDITRRVGGFTAVRQTTNDGRGCWRGDGVCVPLLRRLLQACSLRKHHFTPRAYHDQHGDGVVVEWQLAYRVTRRRSRARAAWVLEQVCPGQR